MDQTNSVSSNSSVSNDTWIDWFCSLDGNEVLCKVSKDYIGTDFCPISTNVSFSRGRFQLIRYSTVYSQFYRVLRTDDGHHSSQYVVLVLIHSSCFLVVVLALIFHFSSSSREGGEDHPKHRDPLRSHPPEIRLDGGRHLYDRMVPFVADLIRLEEEVREEIFRCLPSLPLQGTASTPRMSLLSVALIV